MDASINQCFVCRFHCLGPGLAPVKSLWALNKKNFAPDPNGDDLVIEKKQRYQYLLQNHKEYGLPPPIKDFEDDVEEDEDDDDANESDDDGDDDVESYNSNDPLDRLGDQEGDFKSGFVSIVGNPNVGKSSLMNSLLKEKLSIVTPKPQTTRHRILGILSDSEYQLIFTDTPGMLKGASYKLQETMQEAVRSSTRPSEADVILLMTDVCGEELYDPVVMKRLRNSRVPVIVTINKIDLLRGHRDINIKQKIHYPPASAPPTLDEMLNSGDSDSDIVGDEPVAVLTLKERILRRKRSREYAAAIGLNPASSKVPIDSPPQGASATRNDSSSRDGGEGGGTEDGNDVYEEEEPDMRDVEWRPRPLQQWSALVPGMSGVYESAEDKQWGSGGSSMRRSGSSEVKGVDEVISIWKARLPNAEIIPVSATRGVGLSELVNLILSHCKQGPRHYRSSTLTDKSERFCCAEKIRETIFTQFQEEIPFSTEVVISGFRDVTEKFTEIEATIVVNKESHRAIMIGAGGLKIKEVGTLSRMKIEEFLGRRIYLELKVKVHKNWKNDDNALKKYGYIDR